MAACSKNLQFILGCLGFMYITLMTQFLTTNISHGEIDDKFTGSNLIHTTALPTSSREKLNFSDQAVSEQRKGTDSRVSDFISAVGVEDTVPRKFTFPWKLVVNQECVCSVDEDNPEAPTLLVQVHSHCSNKPQRDAIRQTWGSIARGYHFGLSSHRHRVSLIFLVGGCISDGQNGKVRREAKLYRDIVQWEFADEYGNLTIKSISGLLWALEYCPKVKFILKADDDLYMNVSLLIKHLHNFPSSGLLGYVYSNSTVMRTGLWAVSKAVYPSSTYPPYCSGTAYLMSSDVAYKLLQVHNKAALHLIPVEDVYVTGILAKHSGIICHHEPHFPGWITTPSYSSLKRLIGGELWGLHAVTFDRMYQIWKITQMCPQCNHDERKMEEWFTWMKNKRGL